MHCLQRAIAETRCGLITSPFFHFSHRKETSTEASRISPSKCDTTEKSLDEKQKNKTTENVSQDSPAKQESSALKENPPEPIPSRWVSEYKDPSAAPLIDSSGEYVTRQQEWPQGDLAYRPQPRDELGPRFGYNIVNVRKPESYWHYWRKNPHFNFQYAMIQCVFLFALAWLLTLLAEQTRRIDMEQHTGGSMAGDQLGKGPEKGKNQKVSFSRNEVDALLANAQENYFDAKELYSVGSRDYQMKKIPRPQELNYENLRKK